MKKRHAFTMIGMAVALCVMTAMGGFPELPLVLGTAGDFVILAKTGITTDPASGVTGDMGVSPIAASAITGFSLVMDSTFTFSTSAQVTGKIYASDYLDPTPAKMTTAISDMGTAYVNAAGRSGPDTTEFMSGDISGQTITPGLHKWSTSVLINTDVWLDAQGDADAIFIFQISGDLTMASSQEVILMGGAQAKNIFWQVEGNAGAVIGTYSHFEGILLTAKKIDVLTGASFNGKLLAQTAVNLQGNTIMDADLIPPPVATNLTLTVISEHGVGEPLAGLPPEGLVYTNDYGAALTNFISGLEENGGTQYVNTGWAMTGNGPEAGLTNSMTMVITNDAVLTWQWSTNYLLTASAVGEGAVAGDTNGFYAAGSSVTVTATPGLGYAFAGWTGDVGGASTNDAVLALTLDQARTIVAHFSSAFIDVTALVDWNVNWVFDPRTGYFTGTLTITNRNESQKSLLAPVWFEVASTEWHWLRTPTGIDTNTGMAYLDISAAVNSQLPGIGDGDLALDPGESVTVEGIQLMGRRTPTGLVVAVWTDPPAALSTPVDTDGDGMPDVQETIAGTSAADPNALFRIRLSPDGRSVQWDSAPNRLYKVLIATDLRQGFVVAADNIEGTGMPATFTAVPQTLGIGTAGSVFFRVEVRVK